MTETSNTRTAVVVVDLVLVAVRKVFRVRLLCTRYSKRRAHAQGDAGETNLDLLERHAVAGPGVELVERLPRQLVVRQELRRLDCALQR